MLNLQACYLIYCGNLDSLVMACEILLQLLMWLRDQHVVVTSG